MLEYFTYKKYKKQRDAKDRAETKSRDAKKGVPADTKPGPSGPVLTDDDELFFERLTSETGYSDEDGRRPPLPPRVKTPSISWDSDSADESRQAAHAKKNATSGKPDTKGKGKETKDDKRVSRRFSIFRSKSTRKGNDGVEPTTLAVPKPEELREKDDLTRVLDDLNLSARNNKTFSLSKESQEMVTQFTQVLKDLVNGVPTAANDLRSLLDDHDGTLAKNYEKLPKSMKKMVTQLPTKLTSTLAPELLAVAAEAQGLSKEEAAKGGGLKDQALKLVIPKNMSELITKPGAIVGMLKAIMNFLKVRWPAFIGTNVIWSVALFLLLFVLWYCHKRGRMVRLEREAAAAGESIDHVEELPDSPASAEYATPIDNIASGPASPVGRLPPPPTDGVTAGSSKK